MAAELGAEEDSGGQQAVRSGRLHQDPRLPAGGAADEASQVDAGEHEAGAVDPNHAPGGRHRPRQQVDPLQEGADRDLGGGAAAEGADDAGLDGSGGDGGEELGKPRWGGAPTMARPAGDGGGATWWRSVEAGAEQGGPAAACSGSGSRRRLSAWIDGAAA